jgi:transcription initiation factor TFIIH subunit 2
MADSDPDYDDQMSEDELGTNTNGAGNTTRSQRRTMTSRPKDRAQAKWEAGVSRTWQLQEAADGSIEGMLEGLEEAGKRQR